MADLKDCTLCFLVFLCCFSVGMAGEYCRTDSRLITGLTYCTYGCCGYYPNEYCCSAAVGVVVGSSFAGIAFVCIVIFFICYFVKRGQSTRVVVHPVAQPNNGVTVVSTGHTYAGTSYGGGQPVQPPAYGANPAVPPPYQYNNPAFPPSHPATVASAGAFASAKS